MLSRRAACAGGSSQTTSTSAGAWPAGLAVQVATGLLLAEVNANTLCELGNGGVSLTSMSERTLGRLGTGLSGFCYVLLHYCLLVAYISRAGELTASALALPPAAGLVLFTLGLGGTVYLTSPRQMDAINGVLCVGVVGSFLALLGVASGGVRVRDGVCSGVELYLVYCL